MNRRTLSFAACAIATSTTLLLAGCGDGASPEGSAATSSVSAVSSGSQTTTSRDAPSSDAPSTQTSAAAPTSPADGLPTSEWTTDQKSVAPDADTFLSVTDVRVGTHEGFDRVVIELDGQGARPGYDVRYVDTAVADGSGAPVDVAGGAILEVRVSGWGYPFDTGAEEYSGPRTIPGPGSGSVEQVQLSTAFEGIAQVFIGVTDEEKPFTVTRLDGPTRIVIDIAD
jgi:hypothetical protein